MIFKEAKEINRQEALQEAANQSIFPIINIEKGELADGKS